MNHSKRIPRCFIACFLHSDAAQMIAAMLLGLRAKLDALNWVHPADYHVTLRFLGDLEQARALEIAAALAALDDAPSECELAALDGFPQSSAARVIVLRLKEHGKLLYWHENLGVLTEPTDRHPFIPHVTVARSRAKIPVPLNETKALHGLRIRLAAPALYCRSALLKPDGNVYTAVF